MTAHPMFEHEDILTSSRSFSNDVFNVTAHSTRDRLAMSYNPISRCIHSDNDKTEDVRMQKSCGTPSPSISIRTRSPACAAMTPSRVRSATQ